MPINDGISDHGRIRWLSGRKTAMPRIPRKRLLVLSVLAIALAATLAVFLPNLVERWFLDEWALVRSVEVGDMFEGEDDLKEGATSPTQPLVACGSGNGQIALVEVPDGHVRCRWQAHKDYVAALAFGHDGKSLMSTAYHEGVLRVWEAASGNLLWEGRHDEPDVVCVAASPDGKLLASGAGDGGASADPECTYAPYKKGEIKLWDPQARRPVWTIRTHNKFVLALAFSPDGNYLASAGWDSDVSVWDTTTFHQVSTFVLRTKQSIAALAFSPDSKLLAVGGPGLSFTSRGKLEVWDVSRAKLVLELDDFRGPIASLATHPNQPLLAIAETGFKQDVYSVRFLQWDTLQERRPLRLDWGATQLGFVSDGRYMVAFSGGVNFFKYRPRSPSSH